MNSLANPLKLGTLYCVLSAATYTVYNTCLRAVSEKLDPSWINYVVAAVSVVVFSIYLMWGISRGLFALPPGRVVLVLLTIGLVTQLGAVLFVWAMSIVGVAVVGTLQVGVTLASSALLGLLVLGERISWQQIVAIVLITLAVVCFSLGAQSTEAANPQQEMQSETMVRVLLGIAAAVLSGIAFGITTVCVRKTGTEQIAPEAVVLFISLMGVVMLGPWSAYRLGLSTLLSTPSREMVMMLAAGTSNAVAFFLMAKSLQTISVVRFNVLLNGLMVTLTVAVGVALFAEPWNQAVVWGVALSIAGIVAISSMTTAA